MDRCEFLSEKLSKTLVLHSNSLDYEFFEEEEIGESDAVVNVTDNDQTNLFCSIMAGQMGAGKIFAKASSDSLIPMFEKSGVDVVLSPERAILNELRNKIINKDKNLLAVVARGQGQLLEIEVPESFDSRQIKDLNIPRSAIIGVVRRGRHITIPKGNSFLYKGNKMIVFTKASDSEAVKEFFRRADETWLYYQRYRFGADVFQRNLYFSVFNRSLLRRLLCDLSLYSFRGFYICGRGRIS